MKKFALGVTLVAFVTLAVGGSLSACGSSDNGSGFEAGKPDGTTGTNPGGDDDDNGDGGGDGSVRINPTGSDGSTCRGLACEISSTCPATGDAGGTTITGTVLDPAGANPIYNAFVYVPMYDPASPATIPAGEGIEPITGGVVFPAGVSCDSCSYLYTGNPIAAANTAPDGTFTLTNVPAGTNIPLVVQIGKWRTHTTVASVPACGTTSAGSIKLPSSADGTDPIMSMPQFALSMGNSDSLECLLYRIGIDLKEFTSGPSATGHVHLFTGAGMNLAGSGTAAPAGEDSLWNTLGSMEKYDVSLFSCEGKETTGASPQILEQYVNAGGRAFTSHFHYSWLSGPIDTDAKEGPVNGKTYTQNPDWASLASWYDGDPGVLQAPYFHAAQTDLIGVKINTELNGDAGVFPKGAALTSWLTTTKAYGTNGVAADEVAIQAPAFDSQVNTNDTDSQPWATYDPASYMTGAPGYEQGLTAHQTAYFSFNTPVDAKATTDGGAPPYCGRVVFTGLHVGAAAMDTTTNPTTNDYQLPTATTCSPTPGNLSPQEKILEFMLFDLSACVVSDTIAPPPPITIVR